MPPKKGKRKKKPAAQAGVKQKTPGIQNQNPQDVDMSQNTVLFRTGNYGKLLARFYEPLILLFILGKIRGNLEPERHKKDDLGVRRQFQDDLAYLCEHDKGGSACTAIGLQDCPTNTVYWVAANTNPAKKIVPFLEWVLQDLNEISQLPADERDGRKQAFIDRYLQYAMPKLNKQKNFLKMNIEKCRQNLQHKTCLEDRELCGWLDRLAGVMDDSARLCRVACDFKRSGYMVWLSQLGQHETSIIEGCFSGAHHYIGRFADGIRVPERLFRRLRHPRIQNLVQDPFAVKAIALPPCVPTPEADDATTLEGILKRMLKNDDPEAPSLLLALQEMDRKHFILNCIKKEYDKSTFKPRVHAEVQVLEHFHHNRSSMRWVDGDAFIGCSKPACFCCRLYFRHHPAQPVVPGSHQKLFINWGLAYLSEGDEHAHYTHQRDVLNKMAEDIRRDALKQIREMRNPHPDHADSRTGITSTAADEELFPPTVADWSNSPSPVESEAEDNAVFDEPAAIDSAAVSPASSWSLSADGGGLAASPLAVKQFVNRDTEDDDDDDSDGGAEI